MNKSNAKRIIALIMSLLLMLALFAGCNKDSGTSSDNGNESSGKSDKESETKKEEDKKIEAEFVYQPEYIQMPKDINWINSVTYANGEFIFIGESVTGARRDLYDCYWNTLASYDIPLEEMGVDENGQSTYKGDPAPDGEERTDDNGNPMKYCAELDVWFSFVSEYERYGSSIYKMKADGTDYHALPDYVASKPAEGIEGDYYINSMQADSEGNIWVMENGSFYHYGDDGEYMWDGEETRIRKLSPTGADLSLIELHKSSDMEDYAYYGSMTVDNDGRLYVVDGNSNMLLIYDGEGKMINNVEMGENWINSLFVFGDTLYMSYYKENGMVMTSVDPVAATTGEEIAMPRNAYNFYAGGKYDFCYTDNDSLYGYSVASQQSEKIVNWIDSDINSNNLQNIFPQEDGTILALSNDYESGNGWEIVKFTQVPADQIPVKTVLTLSCVYLDYYLRSAIINFNKNSATTRITVKDYSSFNTEDDYNAGATKLSTEIIAGNVPDIIVFNNLPMSTYRDKGLLEDLYPYLKNDAELKDDVLYEPLKPLEGEDGTLPAIATSYSLNTYAGASSVVGDEPGWTVKEMKEALSRMPAGASIFSPTTTRTDLLDRMCRMILDDYIDMTTGECNFTDPEFKDFLSFIASYPAEFDWNAYYGEDYNWETDDDEALVFNGKLMLANAYVSDVWTLNNLKAQFHNQPFTYIGMPTSSGNGAIIHYDTLIGMSTTCKDKDGAWEFMRTILTQDYQTRYAWSLRLNKTAFEESYSYYMTPQTYIDEFGNEVVAPNTQYIAGQEVEVDYITQNDIDKVLSLAAGARAEVTLNEDIFKIISEEAEAFFSGQKSVDDVCNIIQSRVKIYISERM